jgi:hypothetical protein
MVAKLEGPFHWHKHDDMDDFFLVLAGTLDIELRVFVASQSAGLHDDEARHTLASCADATDDETFRSAARRHLTDTGANQA